MLPQTITRSIFITKCKHKLLKKFEKKEKENGEEDVNEGLNRDGLSLREYKFSTSRVVGTVRCKFPRCRTSTIKKEERGEVEEKEEEKEEKEEKKEKKEKEKEEERGRRMEDGGEGREERIYADFTFLRPLPHDNGGKTSLEVLLQVVSSRPRDCGREPRFHPPRFMAPSSPHFHAAVTLGLLALPFP
ncbi:hypothetical protein V1477_008971 [Vespula maculifrons]|uniref:Uncharacterized protein n=1 Tax=Vespula maculifrons TaxID=7453 RepID=A0ABD2CEI4_VESMC